MPDLPHNGLTRRPHPSSPVALSPNVPGPYGPAALAPRPPEPPAAAGAQASDGLSFRQILATLRRQWPLLLGAAALTTALAAVVLFRQQPKYRAAGLLRVTDVRRAVTSGIENAGEVEESRQINAVLSRIQLLRSRGLLGEVVDSTGLRLRPDYQGFAPGLLADVRVDPDVPPDTLLVRFTDAGVSVRGRAGEVQAPYGAPVQLGAGVRFTVTGRPAAREAAWTIVPREEAIDLLREGLRIAPRTQTDVVEVAYESRRPAVAQRVVNTALALLHDFSGRSAQQQSRSRRLYMEEQLTQADSLFEEAQRALTSFRSRSQLVSARERLSAQQRDVMGLDSRHAELAASRRMFQALLDRLAAADSGAAREQSLRALVSSTDIATSPAIAQVYRQLVQYQLTRDSLTTGTWGAAGTNPDVRRLNDLIATTEQRLLEVVRSHVASLDARIASLVELRASSATTLEALPSMEAEDLRLAQRVETIRKLGDQLREEYQKARMAEASEAGQVEIVDLAALPYRPVDALRGLKLGIALLLGLLLGGAAAWLRERMQTTILRRDELDSLRVASLGVIPAVGTAAGAKPNGRRGRRGGRAPAAGSAAAGSAAVAAVGQPSSELVTLARTHSLGMEAYRALRTNLLFSHGAGQLRSLIVTSTAPGEGKTITAANLAAVCAREDLRVLLVDCDLWRARVHKLFGLRREPGLTEVLQGRCDLAEAIQETTLPGLHLLAAGAYDANPSDVLKSEPLRRLLHRLGDQFDLVILDTPPVLALADAAILSAFADGVLLVVRAGRTDRAAVRQTLRQLSAVGANVLGAVLNDPDGESMRVESYAYSYDYHAVEA